MNIAAGYGHQKAAQRQAQDAALFDFYKTNPTLVKDNPDAEKFINRYAGAETSKAFLHLADMTNQAAEQFQGILGGKPPAAAGPAAPTPAPVAAPAGALATMGPRPSAVVPVGAPAVGAPTPTAAPAVPAPAGMDIQEEIDALTKFAANPEGQIIEQQRPGIIKQTLANLNEKLNRQIKQQDIAQTRAQQQQFHADTEADRAAQRQQSAQMHADSVAMQAQFHGFMEQMARSKNDEEKQVHFSNAQKNLASQTENIAKMLTAATPSDPKTVKTLLDQRNAMARQLKKQAEAANIDYDPEAFKPLTTEQVPGWLASHTAGLIGGSTTTLGAATESAAAPRPTTAPTTFKPGDRRLKNGVTYERDNKGNWHPVK